MPVHCCLHVQVRIVRIFNTYGPRMALDDGRVVSNFVSQVRPCVSAFTQQGCSIVRAWLGLRLCCLQLCAAQREFWCMTAGSLLGAAAKV